ncbi:hypothetical protein E6O75_ATG02588 [Venturia nashicola]|uniref:F-box domain-containing protein n=1 Tax=Venturia nashicola TaxID=86259 RepID=A0A4Z1P5H8_9PEZI|nr:hypothetical protein E6O75_ATG02588 [Venturia nashicola]
MKLLATKQRQKLKKAVELLKKKAKRQPPALLLTYPPEIINNIADNLSFEDLCNLRLVNKAINLVTILLFTKKHLSTLRIDFTHAGLQEAIDLTSHYDVSGTVKFGTRVNIIVFHFGQSTWTRNEEAAWLKILNATKDPVHRRIMKEEARRAERRFYIHREMLKAGLYSQMLTTMFQHVPSLAIGIIYNEGFDRGHLEGEVFIQGMRRLRRPDKTWYQEAPLADIDRLTFFLQELFVALGRNNIHILGLKTKPSGLSYGNYSYLPIERLAGIIRQHEALAKPFRSWAIFEHCAILDISITHQFNVDHTVEDGQTIVRIFKAASQSLTKLALRGHVHFFDVALDNVLTALVKDVYFPKLRNVHLGNGNFQAKNLVAFFGKHCLSLEILELTLVYTNLGAWPSILNLLADMELPKLEDMTICSIGERQMEQNGNAFLHLGPRGHEMRWQIWPDLGGHGEFTRVERGVKPVNTFGVDILKWIAATIKPYE